MMNQITLLDVVALTSDVPQYNLHRSEIDVVVECYPGDAYEVEFVAQDGYTYALVTPWGEQFAPLCEKPVHDTPDIVPAMG